ncbi:MAG TPA: cytochrome c [Candidatus Binatia bacterium]
MTSKKIYFLSLTGLFLLAITPRAFSQGDVVKERKDLMRSNNSAVRAIDKAAKQNAFAAVEENAKQIVANMDKVAALFPKGSTADNSRAKPEIWQNWDAFNQKNAAVKTAAEELAKTAAAKDSAQLEAKVKALGTSSSGACGDCHRTFRARAKR